MTPYERMTRGLVYDPGDREIMDEQLSCQDALFEFNAARPSEEAKRQELMQKMFAEVGEGCFIQPPFYANWGGRHIHLGNFVYANFNLTAVDDAEIFIGDRTMIGPNVTLATAAHPIRCDLRERALQYNRPVRIGRNVWLGAGVIVLPGVSIGDGSVVGAGSVVTKDIPAGVVAVGSPCRVLRPIGEHDREFYNRDCRFDGEE